MEHRPQPGDIYQVGNDYRILVYDMISGYFFINKHGEQATPVLYSLEDVQAYCDNNHVRNCRDKYLGRVYKKQTTLYALLVNDTERFQTAFEKYVSGLHRVDWRQHITVSRSLYTMSGDLPERNLSEPLLIMLSAFVNAFAIGLEKECKDIYLPDVEWQAANKYLQRAAVLLVEAVEPLIEKGIDLPDMYANVFGIAFSMLMHMKRELKFSS